MLIALDTAYADTTAADLRFALDLPPQPALRSLVVPLPAGELTLRLLGASHQVVLGGFTETVACLPHGVHSAALPDRFSRPAYDFSAEIRRLDPAGFRAEVAALRARAAGKGTDEHVLAGEFPGAADALTVLAARAVDGGVTWWTAHAYPQSGELVLTRSKVVTT